MDADSVFVVVNPGSSGGRRRKAVSGLLAALDAASVPREVHHTRGRGHAVQLAREAVARRAGRILIVGGDGTIHEVANGLLADPAGPMPRIAVFPAGTGNDFFQMIGGGRSPAEVVAVLEGGAVECFDVGRVRWGNRERAFVNLLGVGVDVEVLRCRSRFSFLPGLAQYLAAFLNALATFRPPDIQIEVAGREDVAISGRTTLAVITVGPSIGGGFKINPAALPADGKLDLCHFPGMKLREISGLVPKVIRGTHGESEIVTMLPAEEIVIRSRGDAPLRFELDGEPIAEPADELRIEVVPAALPILVPPRG